MGESQIFLYVLDPIEESNCRIDGKIFCEIWRGLPQYPFEQAQAWAKGKALKWETRGRRIWVPPEVVRATNQNPACILIVLVQYHSGTRDTFYIYPAPGTLPDTAASAVKFNTRVAAAPRR